MGVEWMEWDQPDSHGQLVPVGSLDPAPRYSFCLWSMSTQLLPADHALCARQITAWAIY